MGLLIQKQRQNWIHICNKGDLPVKNGKKIIGIMIAVAAVALIVAGIMDGGLFEVKIKAVTICLECIGLG